MLNKNSENEYHNPEVQEILNQYLTTEKYGDMKPILDEIFHRRMVGFSFSRERIEREVRNFSENCESIEFEKSKNCLGNIISSPLAAYDPQKKKIKLFFNPKTIENEDSRNLFLSFMHEVYHATATNGFTTGLSKGSLLSNGIIQREGDAVDEIMNEKATMISGKDDTHEEIERSGYESTQGYGGISIFSNMMANALGVSERNLVSHSVGDRQELMDFYLSRFPESDKEEAKEIFENFELDLQSIYQTHYKDSTAVYAINRDGVEARITDAYKRMSQMFILQTRHDNKEPNDEYYSELITRVEGMKKNYSSINAILSRRELPHVIPEDEYGLTDFHEFIAELANPYFLEYLSYVEIDDRYKYKEENSRRIKRLNGNKSNALVQFLEALKDFLNTTFGGKTNRAHAQLIAIYDEYLENSGPEKFDYIVKNAEGNKVRREGITTYASTGITRAKPVIEQYHRDRLEYGNLSEEQKEYIGMRGISIEEYNRMSEFEREVLFECMGI